MTELTSQLKQGMDASIFIVMHQPRAGMSDFLIQRLQQYTSLPFKIAKHNASIEKGHVYVAPADHHLLIKQDRMQIGHGPQENRWPPSIDVLFRSAAVAFGNHTIGVIMTGILDDGTAGPDCGLLCGK